ncbi:MAG: Cof-type HAD-IIB family hydrolase [Candidatus Fimousia sp.]
MHLFKNIGNMGVLSMKIRVIVMDVDGTLYNSQKKITKKTREALLQAQKQGIRLIVASGRPTAALKDIVDQLQMDHYHGILVCYNGSKVIDSQTGEVLYEKTISIDEGRAVLEHIKKFDQVQPMIDHGDHLYVNDVYHNIIQINGNDFNVIEYEARSGHFKLCEVDDLVDFINFPINKILTTANPEYLQTHYQEMIKPFQNTLNCMFTSDFYVEFTAKDIDKAKALDTVLKPLGYKPEELLAFGDGENDISMLQYAGTSVAMANSSPKVKAIANYETASCDEDGIELFLRQKFSWLID